MDAFKAFAMHSVHWGMPPDRLQRLQDANTDAFEKPSPSGGSESGENTPKATVQQSCKVSSVADLDKVVKINFQKKAHETARQGGRWGSHWRDGHKEACALRMGGPTGEAQCTRAASVC